MKKHQQQGLALDTRGHNRRSGREGPTFLCRISNTAVQEFVLLIVRSIKYLSRTAAAQQSRIVSSLVLHLSTVVGRRKIRHSLRLNVLLFCCDAATGRRVLVIGHIVMVTATAGMLHFLVPGRLQQYTRT